MSSVNSSKDTATADLLNQIRKHILQNQAGRTSSNEFTKTHILPVNDSIAFTDVIDTDPPATLGIVFKITNDAGGGVTVGQEGIISASCITEPDAGQIGAETADGYGGGVHQPGIIETTQCM